jgi:hypothetical protein
MAAPGRYPGLKRNWKDAMLKKFFFYENDLNITNKPDLEYFKLCIYTMNLTTGLLNLVSLSL